MKYYRHFSCGKFLFAIFAFYRFVLASALVFVHVIPSSLEIASRKCAGHCDVVACFFVKLNENERIMMIIE